MEEIGVKPTNKFYTFDKKTEELIDSDMTDDNYTVIASSETEARELLRRVKPIKINEKAFRIAYKAYKDVPLTEAGWSRLHYAIQVYLSRARK